MKSFRMAIIFCIGSMGTLIPLGFSNAQAAAAECGGLSWQKEAEWRTSRSQVPKGEQPMPTTSSREAEIQKMHDKMVKELFDSKDTPEMEFFLTEGPKLANERVRGVYPNSTFPKFKVSNLGSDPTLKMSLLLPVSGHTGIENAKKWAKTDTFTIKLRTVGGTSRDLATDIPSLDIVTILDVGFKLEKGKSYVVEYWRSGSGGPGGYPSGRQVEFEWDGT